jgi:hypothetical protein
MFSAQAVDKENIVRRNKKWVHKIVSEEELQNYCREQDYHLIETGEQYIAICNPGHFRVIC